MLSRNFIKNMVNCPLDSIPSEVLHEAKRSFLNWLGVGVGAHRHSSVAKAINAARVLKSAPQATILGTSIKTDLQFASLINGMSSHVFDFDDTFLDTVLHPSAPVFPALLAWSEHKGISGQNFLQAFVIGVEAEQRIAKVICPSHYNRGWHVTGTVGAFGAAAALGRLMSLSEEQMGYAIGLASTQPTGLREMFGTMAKPFHSGKAAANGLLAVLLAREGFTSSLQALEAKRGFCSVLAEEQDYTILSQPWGSDWQLMYNAYKPFACGVVTHPAIDGAIQLAARGVKADEIEAINLEVHPLVLELTGKTEPMDQLQAKFSVYHCVAAAFLYGKAGEGQFSEEIVHSADVIKLRGKVTARVNDRLAEDQVILQAQIYGREPMEVVVEHALGSPKKPLSDRNLEEKFEDLTAPYLSKKTRQQIISNAWNLERSSDLIEIIQLCIS